MAAAPTIRHLQPFNSQHIAGTSKRPAAALKAPVVRPILWLKTTPWRCLVRVERLELPRLAAPEPKSGVSTNFTIPAPQTASKYLVAGGLPERASLYHPFSCTQRKNDRDKRRLSEQDESGGYSFWRRQHNLPDATCADQNSHAQKACHPFSVCSAQFIFLYIGSA